MAEKNHDRNNDDDDGQIIKLNFDFFHYSDYWNS
mgnify:CR=1 FL=1